MYSVTLFVSISDWFLREFIIIWTILISLELDFCILNKELMKFSNFCHSSCIQKQPPREVLKKKRSENMQQIYRRICSNFIEITLWHGCSPVSLLHIFRTLFPRNTSGWLLLCIPLPFSCILFCRRTWHGHWILRDRKLKISFTFYNFFTQIVWKGINCLRFARSWVVVWPAKATDFWVSLLPLRFTFIFDLLALYPGIGELVNISRSFSRFNVSFWPIRKQKFFYVSRSKWVEQSEFWCCNVLNLFLFILVKGL